MDNSIVLLDVLFVTGLWVLAGKLLLASYFTAKEEYVQRLQEKLKGTFDGSKG